MLPGLRLDVEEASATSWRAIFRDNAGRQSCRTHGPLPRLTTVAADPICAPWEVSR